MEQHTWKGYIQVNGDGVTFYETVEFPVTDEMYRKIQTAIKTGTPLVRCNFCKELEALAEAQFDLAERTGLREEEPFKDDFDDEEEYEAAMEEFQESLDSLWDNYSLECIDIDDPGDIERFKKNFVGKTYKSLQDGKGGSLDMNFQEDFERIVDYSLTVHYDETGTITDITDIEASGLESEGLKSSSWNDCYPNYDLLVDLVEEELTEGFEDDEE